MTSQIYVENTRDRTYILVIWDSWKAISGNDYLTLGDNFETDKSKIHAALSFTNDIACKLRKMCTRGQKRRKYDPRPTHPLSSLGGKEGSV